MRLIAADLDGTCVRYEPDFVVDPVFIEALLPLLEGNALWVMNSDRPFEDMSALANRLEPALRPAALLCRQREIYFPENNSGYQPHASWNDEMRILQQTLWGRIQPNFARWQLEIEKQFTVRMSYVNRDAFAFLVPPDEIDELRIVMQKMIEPFTDAALSGNQEWSFVIHRHFSKARVLTETAARLGICVEETLAIGDGLNDLPMLDGTAASMVGCPANACDEVKELVLRSGGYVAEKLAGDGSAEVLRYFSS